MATQPPTPGDHDDHMELHRRAAQVGGWCWLERRLFELLGAWAADGTDPAVAVFHADMSARHAWHAELWSDRLPVLADVDPEELVVPAGPGTRDVVDRLGALSDGVERLTAVHRCVLPALVGRYRQALATSSPVAEGALHRWGSLVVADDLDEWVRGEELLRAAVAVAATLARALRTQAEVEEALLTAGGLTR